MQKLKNRLILTLNLVLNEVMILQAYLETSKIVLLIILIQVLSNMIDMWSVVIIAHQR